MEQIVIYLLMAQKFINLKQEILKLQQLNYVQGTFQKTSQQMSRTNEKRYIKQLKTCKCKFRLDASVCNNKQRRNEDKCRCECEELIDKRICDKGFIWNPSNCECGCDKSCKVGEYLNYENCKRRIVIVK